ncbi:MAG TPA: Re/Si-specific NAD(P)(+) transhydrogenase subunit alpha [Thermoanaerobaculia bacterium]|nr:Re/Si-specific NAD(P)(+) transhydrogenase subunit alpha [Thermoanaerobaculia bacterium]
MKLIVPKETRDGEKRVALVPESVKKLVKAGVSVTIEPGSGAGSFLDDRSYVEAGATVATDLKAALSEADFVLKVNPPTTGEVDLMRPGAMLLAAFTPSRNLDLVRKLVERKVTAFSTDAIPRITRAQAMDVLSSMASIAGYKAVIMAADALPRYFPMLMTAAGTVLPARVFIIGAGVAGLQAIATARRLGAVVEATDTRPAVRTEIESLGAKFVGVEAGEEAQDAGGYAKKLSEEFYRKQGELIAKHCAGADVVITTALIGGVTAPKLITAEMVDKMKPGSVIVDLAAPGGGNCTLTKPGETVEHNGVKILAPLNLPSEVAFHGSLLYSRNLTAFVMAFWKDGAFALDLSDDILKEATITHDGKVIHIPTAQALEKEGARP